MRFSQLYSYLDRLNRNQGPNLCLVKWCKSGATGLAALDEINNPQGAHSYLPIVEFPTSPLMLTAY
jgi:hypothetical protein